MKKVNVSEATNEQLNWLVAIIEFPPGTYGGEAEHYSGGRGERWTRIPNKAERRYDLARYTTDPAQMWPIIDRERISIRYWDNVALVHAYMPAADEWEEGATGLIAAARAYIVSELGEVVEVPEELT